jgi:enamine deaminase RidA (YjgF/YER057c/UK114 family)
MRIERRVDELGLVLPSPITHPPDVPILFHWVRLRGNRAFVSGHGPLNPDGTIAEPVGSVGDEVTLEQAQNAARLTALATLSSLKAALGDLDRITAWLTSPASSMPRPSSR